MENFNIKRVISVKLCYVICILISFLPNTRTLLITSMVVPTFVDVRDVITLTCSYNIGTQKLNSVKWYKNEKEFYRFAPLMPTKQNMIFAVEGVHVSADHMCNDKICTIHLDNLSNDSSGAYRCEVSGDAPEFKLSHETSNMTVAALPQHDPKIEGVEKNYYDGDFLFGNCTSDFSFPPPILAWYINDQKADSNLLQPFQESTVEAYGFKLHQRSLEIRFRIDKKINPFITDGKVHMRCVAQIRKMPAQIRESVHIFEVSSVDVLRNQKLTNWKNAAPSSSSKTSGMLLIFSIFAFINYALCTSRIVNIYR